MSSKIPHGNRIRTAAAAFLTHPRNILMKTTSEFFNRKQILGRERCCWDWGIFVRHRKTSKLKTRLECLRSVPYPRRWDTSVQALPVCERLQTSRCLGAGAHIDRSQHSFGVDSHHVPPLLIRHASNGWRHVTIKAPPTTINGLPG